MHGVFRTFIAANLGLAASLMAFDRNEWELVFEDNFNRAEVGSDWVIQGKSEIVDGRLKYGLEGSHLAMINRSFSPDVRIEFDAQPAPEKAPCDLSVGLSCGKSAGGYGTGYLVAFGGNYNMLNQIQGGRDMKWIQDYNPKKKIVPGQVHHICGMKEGKTITLEVDNEVLVTATDHQPLGGPGFDGVGLMTWNGMLADNVKVYERKTKHPDTPRYVYGLKGLPFVLDDDRKLSLNHEWAGFGSSQPTASDEQPIARAIALFNGGKPREAEAEFLKLADPQMRAAGAAFCIGHLYHEASINELQRVGQMLIDLAAANAGDERLQDYGQLGLCIKGLNVMRFDELPNGELIASTILAMGRAHNPVYDKADFFKARLMRAHCMEGGDYKAAGPTAKFRELLAWYPDNSSLRELTGEKITWGDDLVDDTSDAPAWARYVRELYARQCRVLDWWFTKRQYKTGELGGGWGDDCEILRDWGPLAVISTGHPSIVAGIERLCQGIWESGSIDRAYGFGHYGDVEHSSEASSDTQPTMMIVRWGDPLWIERNMLTAKTIRDIYMGVDETGHYRFKSGHYGGGNVGDQPAQEGDVHYNTRTMKHMQHLAFWGNKEARRVYLSWMEGWLEQTMRAYPNKPVGVVPGQLFFPTGTPLPPYGSPKDWVSTNAHANAPDPDHIPGMGRMIHSGFVSAYWLTRDARFLEPMQQYLYRTSYGPLIKDSSQLRPGTREWVIVGQQGDSHTDTMACFRGVTGDKTVDEYLMRFASPYQRYLVDNDLEKLIAGVEQAAKEMRTNFRLMTEELLQTDRAGLPMMQESVGAYTGALHNWRDGLLPTMAVTWDVPDANFAAMVVAGTDVRLRTWVYSFHDEPVRMGLRIWRLTPGVYTAVHGEIMPGEGRGNLRYGWSDPSDFIFRRRLDTCYVTVPPRKPYCIDLRLVRPIDVPAMAADAAIADRDVAMQSPGTLTAVVHNVGNETMNDVSVVLETSDDSRLWKRVAEQRTETLPAPGFDPVTRKLLFKNVPAAKAYRVTLDPDNKLDELYEGNNVGTLTVAGQ
jgi:hypothetical protein